jgi:hypothetical protein
MVTPLIVLRRSTRLRSDNESKQRPARWCCRSHPGVAARAASDRGNEMDQERLRMGRDQFAKEVRRRGFRGSGVPGPHQPQKPGVPPRRPRPGARPSGTLPPLSTDAPSWRAMMAAGSPEAPAPAMTTSALWSKRTCPPLAPLRSWPAAAPAPAPVTTLRLRKSLRFTVGRYLSTLGLLGAGRVIS